MPWPGAYSSIYGTYDLRKFFNTCTNCPYNYNGENHTKKEEKRRVNRKRKKGSMDTPNEKGTKMLMRASVTSLLLSVILLCDVISAHKKCFHLISCNFLCKYFLFLNTQQKCRYSKEFSDQHQKTLNVIRVT